MRTLARGLVFGLVLTQAAACTRAAPSEETVSGEPPPTVVEQQPSPDPPTGAQAELDRTIWDCEWSIVVFWGPHWYWNHRDVSMAAMGVNTLYTREDLELVYGPDRSFEAALRHREWPNGQHDPMDYDGPLERYTYAIDGKRLTIDFDGWTDGPLECTAGCYDQDFIDFMDAHYSMKSSAADVGDKRRAGDCGR